MLKRPSPSMVVACIALAVALGGTGYAATTLPPKSVGRKQIRFGSVGPSQIRAAAVGTLQLQANAVTSAKVVDGSLQARDLARGVLPAKASVTVRVARGDAVKPGGLGAASVPCNPGELLTGGGGGFDGAASINDKVVDSIPVSFDKPPARWRVTMFNGAEDSRTPIAYAICARP